MLTQVNSHMANSRMASSQCRDTQLVRMPLSSSMADTPSSSTVATLHNSSMVAILLKVAVPASYLPTTQASPSFAAMLQRNVRQCVSPL